MMNMQDLAPDLILTDAKITTMDTESAGGRSAGDQGATHSRRRQRRGDRGAGG